MKKVLRLILILLGVGIGPVIVLLINNVLTDTVYMNLSQIIHAQIFDPKTEQAYVPMVNLTVYTLSGIITGIISIFLSKGLAVKLYDFIQEVENELSGLPASVLVSGSIGLVLGLLTAFLLSQIVSWVGIPWITITLSILLYVVLGYLGVKLGIRRKGDISILSRYSGNSINVPKILDTSVIIDGRIFDICKSGFIEGQLIVPEFVLSELRHIADCSDALKRNRGRRGLDIISKIQKELDVNVEISDKDFEDVEEVDVKLIKLAKELGGKVVTNDYNLNKVAAVQDVFVLNINELSNAVKPISLPGEEMTVVVVKEGKETGQGIAYLEDGTMIVVEGGREKLNEKLQVVVTSVLQTPAGRMIFSKIKSEENEIAS